MTDHFVTRNPGKNWLLETGSTAIKNLASYGKVPVAIYSATVLGIVSIDLLAGVIIGLALTIGKLLWKASRLDIKVQPDEARLSADLHLEGIASFLKLPQTDFRARKRSAG